VFGVAEIAWARGPSGASYYEMEPEEALGEHRQEDEPAGEDRLIPLGAEEADRAAQRMAHQDGRREYRPALLEQKGEVGGRRRSEREDQSEGHDKAGRRVVAGVAAIARGLDDPPRFSAAVNRTSALLVSRESSTQAADDPDCCYGRSASAVAGCLLTVEMRDTADRMSGGRSYERPPGTTLMLAVKVAVNPSTSVTTTSIVC
jgi:hypothetical protein